MTVYTLRQQHQGICSRIASAQYQIEDNVEVLKELSKSSHLFDLDVINSALRDLLAIQHKMMMDKMILEKLSGGMGKA